MRGSCYAREALFTHTVTFREFDVNQVLNVSTGKEAPQCPNGRLVQENAPPAEKVSGAGEQAP